MFLFLPSLRAATSLFSTNTSFPQRLQEGYDGRRAWDVSVLSLGDGFRVSQGPSLGQAPSSVLAAGPRFNFLLFHQRTFTEHQLRINFTGWGRFQEVEMGGGTPGAGNSMSKGADAGTQGLFNEYLLFLRGYSGVGWGGEGNSSRGSWKGWLRLRLGLDGPGEEFGL